MPRNLQLVKGTNNGVEQGVLYEVDENGNATAFNLTGATITVEVYQEDGTVLVSFAATINDAANGIYTARPSGTAFDSVDDGEYLWRTRVINATYTDGRVFAEDINGNPQYCTLI